MWGSILVAGVCCIQINYHLDFERFTFFLIKALLCLSIKIGAAPRDATVSTRKRQLCLRVAEQREHFETLRMIVLNQVLTCLGHTFYRCLQSHRLGGRGRQKTLRV